MAKKKKPKQREPFFRKDRQVWYVQLDGKQINRGPDRHLAWRRYHELMAARSRQQNTALPETKTVVAALERFLGYIQTNRSERTYDFYLNILKTFRVSLPTQSLTVAGLMPAHVTDWMARHPQWGPTTRHGAIHAVKKAIRWACKEWNLGQSSGRCRISHAYQEGGIRYPRTMARPSGSLHER